MTSLTDSTLICSKKNPGTEVFLLLYLDSRTSKNFPLAAFKFHFYLSFLPYLHFAPSGGHKCVLEQPFCYADRAFGCAICTIFSFYEKKLSATLISAIYPTVPVIKIVPSSLMSIWIIPPGWFTLILFSIRPFR